MGRINYEKSLENYRKRIEQSKDISEKNKELILKFQDKCFALGGRSTNRIVKYTWILMRISSMIDFDFDKATREAMERLVAEIRKSDMKEWTKHDYLVALKCFYKDVFGKDDDYPPIVKFIKTNISREFKKQQQKERTEYLLKAEDVERMVEAAPSLKWKAFIKFMFDFGARITETLDIQNRHISWEGDMVEVIVSGKTGTRSWSVVDCVPLMSAWREIHPKKDEPNAYFFCSNGEGKKMSYATVSSALNEIKRKTKLDKPVNPHALRRASATYWSDFLNSVQLCDKYGWVQGSQVVQSYIYRNNQHKEAIARIYGMKNDNEPKKTTNPKKCDRCGNMNDSTVRHCMQCGFVFDVGLRIDHRKKDLIRELVMEKVVKKNPKIKILVEEAAKELSNEINRILEKE